MSEAKFTPGPWKMRSGIATGMVEIVAASTRGLVKVVCRLGGFFRNKYANAHLIAAAPEMYELLTVIMANAEIIPDPRMGGATECYAVPLDDIEGIRALLSKARGEQTKKEN